MAEIRERQFVNQTLISEVDLKKQEILELATCRFLEKKANVLFIGQPGTGKTHLSVALGLQALGYGKTVQFSSVWEMIQRLQASRADFKKAFNLRAPGRMSIPQSGFAFFNIEKK